jgi:hypothetical protein
MIDCFFLDKEHAMARTTVLVPHATVDEVEAAYRQARDPVTRTHLQILWLLA